MNWTMKFILMKGNRIHFSGVLRLVWLVLISSAFTVLAGAQIPDPQNPPRLVNDFAGLLTETERSGLERQLIAYDDSTSTQIVVVTVRELGNYDISEFSYEL